MVISFSVAKAGERNCRDVSNDIGVETDSSEGKILFELFGKLSEAGAQFHNTLRGKVPI